jgi:hypothetical protein
MPGEPAKQVLMDASEEASGDTAVAIEEALAEQSLLGGELEFDLYGLDPGKVEGLDDEMVDLWLAQQQAEEADDWD